MSFTHIAGGAAPPATQDCRTLRIAARMVTKQYHADAKKPFPNCQTSVLFSAPANPETIAAGISLALEKRSPSDTSLGLTNQDQSA